MCEDPNFMKCQAYLCCQEMKFISSATSRICSITVFLFSCSNYELYTSELQVIDYYAKKGAVAQLHAEKAPKEVTVEVQKVLSWYMIGMMGFSFNTFFFLSFLDKHQYGI